MATIVVKEVGPTGTVFDKSEYTGTDKEIDQLYKKICGNIKKFGLSNNVLIEIVHDNPQSCSLM